MGFYFNFKLKGLITEGDEILQRRTSWRDLPQCHRIIESLFLLQNPKLNLKFRLITNGSYRKWQKSRQLFFSEALQVLSLPEPGLIRRSHRQQRPTFEIHLPLYLLPLLRICICLPSYSFLVQFDQLHLPFMCF